MNTIIKTNNIPTNIPKIIFIVPYRNRKPHLDLFLFYMPYLLNKQYENNEYQILICHQNDKRPFNRGAMKNLGFYYSKKMYPNDYKSITFVFNDVDTLPGSDNMFDYKTTNGIIKHFYGFTFALGGFFSITGNDFEKINGFPNYWNWGFEDNCLQIRASKQNIKIDRSQFYKINDINILQFFNGRPRVVDSMVTHKLREDNGINGISDIKNIEYKSDIIENQNEKQNNIYEIKFNKWNVSEDHTKVVFEKLNNPSKVIQRKVSMRNILRLR
jgi:hypothetical protein